MAEAAARLSTCGGWLGPALEGGSPEAALRRAGANPSAPVAGVGSLDEAAALLAARARAVVSHHGGHLLGAGGGSGADAGPLSRPPPGIPPPTRPPAAAPGPASALNYTVRPARN